jgi:hypothetical protein
LFGSLKEFQRAKLACKYATPGCKKRSCSPADGRNAAMTRAPTPQQDLAAILQDGRVAGLPQIRQQGSAAP